MTVSAPVPLAGIRSAGDPLLTTTLAVTVIGSALPLLPSVMSLRLTVTSPEFSRTPISVPTAVVPVAVVTVSACKVGAWVTGVMVIARKAVPMPLIALPNEIVVDLMKAAVELIPLRPPEI